MKFFVNLNKAFDKTKLVQRVIPVKRSGKTFMRKQWVRVDEVDTPQAPKKTTIQNSEDIKKKINELRDTLGKDKVIELAKKQGISWKEDKHPGINWMRASMSIQKHLKEGKSWQEIIDKQEPPMI